MNKREKLLNRRKNQVLKNRHVRHVSLRHVPHPYTLTHKKEEVTKQAVIEEKKLDVLTTDEKVVETKTKESLKQEKHKKTAEEVAKEKEDKLLAKQEKKKQQAVNKALKKQQKIQDKEDQLNRLIDEPSASIFLILTNPVLCMNQLSNVDYATLSTGQRVILNVMKWFAISACLAILIENLVNQNPFGFSRMNFTSTAILAFKLAIYGYVFEILAGILISVLSSVRQQDKIDRARMVSICTISAPFKIVLFIVSAVAIKCNTSLGIAVFLASVLLTILMTGNGLGKCELPPRRCLLAIGVVAFVALYLFGNYFSIFASDVVNILKNIMNI